MDNCVRLGDVVSIQRGTTYKSALLGQPGPVLLGLGTIERHGGFRADKLKTYGGDSPEALLVRPGQLYASLKDVTQTADLLGAVAMVPRNGQVGRLTQDTVRLDLTSDVVSPDYLYWILRTPEYREYCRGHATGTTTMGLSREDFFAFQLPIPDEGRMTLTRLLGALDDKIAATDKAAQVAFALAHSIVLEVLHTDNGMGGMSTTFGLLGDLFDGPHATPTRCSEGPYFLNISSLTAGRLDLAESDHVSEADFSGWTRRVTPQEGDLLFSYETRLGEAALMPGGVRACLGRRMALLRPDRKRVIPEFLLHFYLSPSFQRTISERTVHGATVPRIGLATMGEWEVEIPVFEQQQCVADQLRSLHAVVDHSDVESAQLAGVRDKLLPLLMSGKVMVKDVETAVAEVV